MTTEAPCGDPPTGKGYYTLTTPNNDLSRVMERLDEVRDLVLQATDAPREIEQLCKVRDMLAQSLALAVARNEEVAAERDKLKADLERERDAHGRTLDRETNACLDVSDVLDDAEGRAGIAVAPGRPYAERISRLATEIERYACEISTTRSAMQLAIADLTAQRDEAIRRAEHASGLAARATQLLEQTTGELATRISSVEAWADRELAAHEETKRELRAAMFLIDTMSLGPLWRLMRRVRGGGRDA
jgi:hypothetical protein